MAQKRGRALSRRVDWIADAIRLERSTAPGSSVVEQYVHQRMPHPGALRALVAPEHLLGDVTGLAKMETCRGTAREVDPGAIECNEAIHHQLAHVCQNGRASWLPGGEGSDLLRDPRAGVRECAET